jgi:hypothetical protein
LTESHSFLQLRTLRETPSHNALPHTRIIAAEDDPSSCPIHPARPCTYHRIVIKSSNITLDGNGAAADRRKKGDPKTQGIAISPTAPPASRSKM